MEVNTNSAFFYSFTSYLRLHSSLMTFSFLGLPLPIPLSCLTYSLYLSYIFVLQRSVLPSFIYFSIPPCYSSSFSSFRMSLVLLRFSVSSPFPFFLLLRANIHICTHTLSLSSLYSLWTSFYLFHFPLSSLFFLWLPLSFPYSSFCSLFLTSNTHIGTNSVRVSSFYSHYSSGYPPSFSCSSFKSLTFIASTFLPRPRLLSPLL